MILRYVNTMDDLYAFRRHLTGRSLFVRGVTIVAFVAICASILRAVLSVEREPGDGPVFHAVVLTLTAALMIAFVYVAIRLVWTILDRLTLRLMMSSGKNAGVLCQHELEIDEDGIVERTDVGESSVSWHGVEEIVETQSHVFVHVGALMAHVIPKSSVVTGDPESFVARARALWQSANPDARLDRA